MRLLIAILIGKIIALMSRLLNIGGGSAAPGLYALSIEPALVQKLVATVQRNVVITGTNGKTTTAKMLNHFAKASGLKVIRNHTGSNLERGIASTLIQNSRLHLEGVKLNYDLGIWELDEAAFNTVAPKLQPDVIVFLNVFRDQLDRYGEIDTVVKNWCQTLKQIPAGTLVLVNGDDANTLRLVACFKGKIKKFGVKDFKIIGESIVHNKEQEELNFEAKDVKLNGLDGSRFLLIINRKSLIINLPLPGVYHIYDALAAFAIAYQLDLPIHRLTDSLKHYSPAFGRVEKLPLPASLREALPAGFGYIFLIKNPAGATQVFETIAPNMKNNDQLLLALNDNPADGTDVSWIWDVNFELIQNSSRAKGSQTSPKPRDFQIYAAGSRAYDLAVRLKYAGFDPKTIIVEPDLKKAFRQARTGLKGRQAGRRGKIFILPTYTAMLELQSILAESGIKKHYWKEE